MSDKIIYLIKFDRQLLTCPEDEECFRAFYSLREAKSFIKYNYQDKRWRELCKIIKYERKD